MRSFSCSALLCLVLASTLRGQPGTPSADRPLLFSDDFEHGLSRWIVSGNGDIAVHQTGSGHGGVMRLRSNGDIEALIGGSETWGDIAIEGDLRFADDDDSYLGLVYNYRRRGARSDFGLLYLKYGRRVYLQPNPHRDYNVTRKLYPEYQASVTGVSTISVGEWQRFRAEVVGGACHFYVGETSAPQLTFEIREAGPGKIGFQPRSVGGEVWIDNIRASRINRFTYQGPPQPGVPAPNPRPGRWEVLGPLVDTRDSAAVAPRSAGWRSFDLDPRGAIETGRVVDYHGPRTVAYFRTVVRMDAAGPATLRLSSIDDVAVWLNGRFRGFFTKQANAWVDFWSNPEHGGDLVPLDLVAGENTVVIRVRGGAYASGGFYARVEGPGVIPPDASGHR